MSAAESATVAPAEAAARAERYNGLGRHTDAERILRRALRSYPREPAFFSLLAYTLTMQERYDEALAVTGDGLALDPDEPDLLYQRAGALGRLDRTDEAIETALHCLALNPVTAMKLYLCTSLGSFHNTAGRYATAFEFAERGLALDPDDADLLEIAAESLRRRNRVHEAEPYYRAALTADPFSADAWYCKALNDMKLGRARDSLAGFARSMELEASDDWKSERVRNIMCWPLASYAESFRWAIPLAAIAALFHASGAGPAWRWLGLTVLTACFGYAVNWFYRGGTAVWRALPRQLPLEKLGMALAFLLSQLGVAAVAVSLLTGDATPAWTGLATAVLLWLALGLGYALDPDEGREKSLPLRTLDCTAWLFGYDFTDNPRLLWHRLRHRLTRRVDPGPDPRRRKRPA